MAGDLEEVQKASLHVATSFVWPPYVGSLLGTPLQSKIEEERIWSHPRLGAVLLARLAKAASHRLRRRLQDGWTESESSERLEADFRGSEDQAR